MIPGTRSSSTVPLSSQEVTVKHLVTMTLMLAWTTAGHAGEYDRESLRGLAG